MTDSLQTDDLDLGFIVGLDLQIAVQWASRQGFEFVELLLDGPYARERDLVPCLENIISSYYTAERFPDLLARYPDAQMSFDTSHALLSGMAGAEMATFCREYADRIGHLHLVDTRGSDDEHLPVGMRNLDFATVLTGLAAADWRGTATLEIGTKEYDTIALGKSNTEKLLRG